MTEDQFWQLIDDSRSGFDPQRRDGNMDRQRNALHDLLSQRPTEEVREFATVMNVLVDRAYRWDLWGAAHVIGSGCSDDWFDYFRYWLISMGARVYENALSDPDSLVTAATQPGVEDVFFEELGYVAWSVLEERGVSGTDPPHVPPAEPAGQRWKNEDLPHRFPKLWAIYGER